MLNILEVLEVLEKKYNANIDYDEYYHTLRMYFYNLGLIVGMSLERDIIFSNEEMLYLIDSNIRK